MKYNRTADAVEPGHENVQYSEEMIDILSDECVRIFRPLIRDDGLRMRVLADAFAKEQVRCHKGDVFSCLREGEEIAGNRVSFRLVEKYPFLYGNVEIDDSEDCTDDQFDDICDEEYSDQEDSGFEDPFDEFCDGCCEDCPIACACIPVFILDGIEFRVVLLERDTDD